MIIGSIPLHKLFFFILNKANLYLKNTISGLFIMEWIKLYNAFISKH